MRTVYFLFLVSFLLIGISFYLAFLLKPKTISTFKPDLQKITLYSQGGYDTQIFEKMYGELLNEVELMPFYILPFRTEYLKNKHDNILRLTQAGYATEVTKQKELVQSRLTYLRDRIKNSTYINESKKLAYFDTFEVVAGNIFEKNSDLHGIRDALVLLGEQDAIITKEMEMGKKEWLRAELERYKATCEELRDYFSEKNNIENQPKAEKCINAADELLQAKYSENGADFVETLSRERVFTLVQEVSQAKLKLIQDEEYALAMKKKEEERLTLVPPAPRQEGKVIVINLGLQRLYAYENGGTVFPKAVTITTGKYGFETVTGEFAIYLKEQNHRMRSPFPGIYYDNLVSYWMPFYLGYGLHDAPWRSIYGTQDYSYVGSHGCVNMPFSEASILYNWAEVGTRVLVL